MNRWQVTPPHEWSGAWTGRLQICCRYAAKTDVCAHAIGSFISNRMPADCYLG